MKKTMTVIYITVFMAILVLPTLVWVIFLITKPDVIEKWDYSLEEKRDKAEFPEHLAEDGNFSKLESWYNDRVPFRSMIISAKQSVDGNMETVYRENWIPVLAALLYGKGEEGKVTDSSNVDISNMFGDNTQGTSSVKEPVTLPSGEHEYVQAEYKMPSCTEEGYIIYKCTDCDESYTEILSVKEHDYDIVEVVEASYQQYGYTLRRCNSCNEEYKSDFVEKPVDTSYFPLITERNIVIIGRYNWLFFAGDNSVDYYTGSNLLSEQKLEEYLELTLRLYELCNSKGIRLQLMIVPNKEQVYSEYMPTCQIVSEKKRIPLLTEYFKENADIDIIYPLNEMLAAKRYWQVYCSHDTHWNNMGAMIGTQALLKGLGMKTTNLLELNAEEWTFGGGDLIVLGGLDVNKYPTDINYTIDYKPEINAVESGGDALINNDIFSSVSDSPNKCKFVMLSDSFRFRMLPYLEKEFSNCVIAHRSSVRDIEDSVREADVLVLAAVERYDYDLFDTMKAIIEILSE